MIAQPLPVRNPVFTNEDRDRLTQAGVLFNHKGRTWTFARPCPTCGGFYRLQIHETDPQFIPANIVARLTGDGLQCMACQKAAQRQTAPSLLHFVPRHTGNGGGGKGRNQRRPRQASQGKTPAKLNFSTVALIAKAHGLVLTRRGRVYELFQGPHRIDIYTRLDLAIEAIRENGKEQPRAI